jgi:hypothetical protein
MIKKAACCMAYPSYWRQDASGHFDFPKEYTTMEHHLERPPLILYWRTGGQQNLYRYI